MKDSTVTYNTQRKILKPTMVKIATLLNIFEVEYFYHSWGGISGVNIVVCELRSQNSFQCE